MASTPTSRILIRRRRIRAVLAPVLLLASTLAITSLSDSGSEAVVSPGNTVRVSVNDDGSEGTLRVIREGEGTNRVGEDPAISADGRFVAFESLGDLADDEVNISSQFISNIYLHDRDVDEDGVFDEAGGTSTILVSMGFVQPPPVLTCSPASIDFGTVIVGSTSMSETVTCSTGDVPVTISETVMGGADAGDFSSSACGTFPIVVAPGDSCAFDLTFSPTAVDARSATFSVVHNGANGTQVTSLSGEGISVGTLSCTPGDLDFQTTDHLVPATQDVTCTASDGQVFVDAPSIANQLRFTESGGCTGALLEPGTSCTISVGFTPDPFNFASFTSTLIIQHDGTNAPQTVLLTATDTCTGSTVPCGPVPIRMPPSTDRIVLAPAQVGKAISGRGSQAVAKGSHSLRGAPVVPMQEPDRVEADGDSRNPVISGDGRFVAFESRATNLLPTQAVDDGNGSDSDIFVWDREAGTEGAVVALISPSLDEPIGFSATRPSISADGTVVTYELEVERLQDDVTVRDDTLGISESADWAAGVSGGAILGPDFTGANPDSVVLFSEEGVQPIALDADVDGEDDDFIDDFEVSTPSISAAPTPSTDGRYIAMAADVEFNDGDSEDDMILVFDREQRSLDRVDVQADLFNPGSLVGLRAQGEDLDQDYEVFAPAISGDGRVVAFVAGPPPPEVGILPILPDLQIVSVDRDVDGNGTFEFNEFDQDSTWLELISATTSGEPGNGPSGVLASQFSPDAPAISTDGRYIAFSSRATDLTNDAAAWTCLLEEDGEIRFGPRQCENVFMHDRATGVKELISVARFHPPARAGSGQPAITADGRFVAISSFANNLIGCQTSTEPGYPVSCNPSDLEDTNDARDVFVRELTPNLVCEPNPSEVFADEFGSTVICRNTTNGPLRVLTGVGEPPGVAITGAQASQFVILSDGCSGQTLHRDDDCIIGVRATNTTGSIITATLEVTTDGAVSRQPEQTTVSLVSRGGSSGFSADPSDVDFGSQLLLSSTDQTITITNTSSETTMTIGSVVVDPVGAIDFTGDYQVVADDCSGISLFAGESCTVTIRYAPTFREGFDGDRPVQLVFFDDAPGGPHVISVTGRSPLPTVVLNPGVGNAGTVVTVTGFDFPAELPVEVGFADLPVSATGTTDAAGGFALDIVVFAIDGMGPRDMVATVGTVEIRQSFLITLGTTFIDDDLIIRD